MLEHPHTTSSLTPIVTNTVRIEKLSDDEDADVDITDEPGDEGNAEDKRQIVVKTELCEEEQPTPTEIPTDEQREGQEETKDQHSNILLPITQSPQSSASHLCSEEYGVSRLDEKRDQTEPCTLKTLEATAQTDSKQMTDVNEGQCSHTDGPDEALQLEEPCHHGPGTNHNHFMQQ